MTTPQVLRERIERYDWNLHHCVGGARYPQYHTAWHPALPRTMLEAFALPPRAHIADPFCGGGTTLAEARMRDLYATGIDRLPLAVLMSRVRTRDYPPERLADAVQRWAHAYEACPMPDPAERDDARVCFPDESIQTLLRAERAWAQVAPDEPEWREWFAVALIPHLRALSMYSERTPKRVRRPTPIPPARYHRFPSVLTQRMHAMRTYNLMIATLAPQTPPAEVQLGDCAELPHPLHAILTSPPYGISYRYEEVYEPANRWLRLEPPAPAPAPQPEHWSPAIREWYARFQHTTPALPYQLRWMAESLDMLQRFAHAAARTLQPGSPIGIALAETTLHQTRIPNPDLMHEAMTHAGFEPVTRILRRLPYTRIPTARDPRTGRFTSQPAPPAFETLLFYTRP